MMGKRQLDLVQDYTGHAYDMVLGVYYAKARMYDADNRRFMAVDPVCGNISNPQTIVQYTYCLNNSLIYWDPLGLFDSKTRLKRGAGATNLKSNDSQDILKLQIRLQSLGLLSLDFAKYGLFDEETEIKVNEFKDLFLPSGNKDDNRGVVGITTWRHLGLDSSIVNYEDPITKNNIMLANQFAQSNLNERFSKIFYTLVKVGNTFYTQWDLFNWTLGYQYYQKLQCILANANIGEFLVSGVDIVSTAYSSYQEAVAMGCFDPVSQALVAGGIFLSRVLIDNPIDNNPDLRDIYSITLEPLQRENIEKNRKMLESILNSPLKYVVTKSQPMVAQNLAKNAVFDAIKYTFAQERSGNISNAIRINAVDFLESIIKLTVDDKERINLLNVRKKEAGL
jgi:RHS repeat-associated protein